MGRSENITSHVRQTGRAPIFVHQCRCSSQQTDKGNQKVTTTTVLFPCLQPRAICSMNCFVIYLLFGVFSCVLITYSQSTKLTGKKYLFILSPLKLQSKESINLKEGQKWGKLNTPIHNLKNGNLCCDLATLASQRTLIQFYFLQLIFLPVQIFYASLHTWYIAIHLGHL